MPYKDPEKKREYDRHRAEHSARKETQITCQRCGVIFTPSRYATTKTKWCPDCRPLAQREWFARRRKEKREELNEDAKVYYQENREERRAYGRAWWPGYYATHREQKLAYTREWYQRIINGTLPRSKIQKRHEGATFEVNPEPRKRGRPKGTKKVSKK